MDRERIHEALLKVDGWRTDNAKVFGNLLDTIEWLCTDERILTEAKCNAIQLDKKAKEIALEYAIRINPTTSTKGEDLVEDAEKIYNWLIKE